MPAGLEPLVAFWKEWGTLALVLLSSVLQVILLITAEIRRRKDSRVLKVVVWSAYVLADTTAIYVLGHMSVSNTTSRHHQLTAFWAPFLLLHLGGQDNITAYSIEDNRLWLRHLQSFVIQVFAAAYVLYESSILAQRTLLCPAAILMFVVGFVKYGERVCALKLASSGSNQTGKNYKSVYNNYLLNPNGHILVPSKEKYSQTFGAHLLLHYPKIRLKGMWSTAFRPSIDTDTCWEHMYGVAEVQLSLMHDIFYSKAELIHTWHGYCIRAFSLPSTVAALLLFHGVGEKDGYRKADIAATYVLLAGAVIMEITSVLRAMFSTWVYGKIIRKSPRVASGIARLSFWSHELARSAMCRGSISARYWSSSMGQHNFIYMCSHCKDSRGSKIARLMGQHDRWNMLVYTSSVPVSSDIIQLLKKYIMESVCINHENPANDICNSRGRAALMRRPGLYEELGWSVDIELDESILVWHIATDIYLSWYQWKHAGRPHHLAQVTQELSNYMMFLLAARPYMLPDNTSRQSYIEMCYQVLYYSRIGSTNGLLELIRQQGDAIISEIHVGTFGDACKHGAKLISKEQETSDAKMLELISQVWIELLCYTAHRCRPDSHARRLCNGGEFTTVVALMLEYTRCGLVRFSNEGEQLQGVSVVSMPGSTTACTR